MSITAQDVKTLREKTGAGMMDCKKALTESGGDFEKAIDYLRKKGMSQARKRTDRAADEGVINAYISPDGKVAVILELNCETDFVAKTPDFKDFVQKLVVAIAEQNPAADEWQSVEINDATAAESLQALATKLGENIKLRRFKRLETTEGIFDAYVHTGDKLGVLLELKISEFTPESLTLGHDLAMQIAASNPTAVKREEIPRKEIDKELEIYRTQARNEGKPEKIIDRIAEGKLNKFYQDVCLLEQPFIKEKKTIVNQHISAFTKETGIDFEVIRFARFAIGGN